SAGPTAGTFAWVGGSVTLTRDIILNGNGTIASNNNIILNGTVPAATGTLTWNGSTATSAIGFGPALGTLGATLTLTGNNTNNNIFGMQLVDGVSNALTVVKTGVAGWTLTNTINTFSGGFIVNSSV